jgi:putative membrane protein
MFILFLKGIFMGSADIIPGVSGGTIALITGIYEQLVNALRSIDLKFIPYFFGGFLNKSYFHKAKKNFLSIEFTFLLPLGLGVALAFLSLAHILGYFLTFYPSYTYSFFFGLIFASALFVYTSIKGRFSLNSLLFIIVGFVFGFLLVGLEAIRTEHSVIIIFISGVITFCAMILPGISGAFILIFLGQYDFLLGVLRELASLDFSRVTYALSYIFGGIIGLLVFSRALSFLFSRYRIATLSFIVGLMIGALREPGELILHNPENVVITVLSSLLGVSLVAIVSYYGKRQKTMDF